MGGFTDANVDGLISAAAAEPAGFQLLFVQGAREPEFEALAERFRATITETAHHQLSKAIRHPGWARWAAQLAPKVAIEAIVAWLDAGRPDPDLAADRVRHVIAGAVAVATDGQHAASLPPTV